MSISTAEIVFIVTLLATYSAAIFARLQTNADPHEGLAGMRLNRWLVGLSAATTANSGFVVTGAVGLGYAYGMQWVLLPLSWLLGDLLFWYLFPARINEVGREYRATTISELLAGNLTGRTATLLSVVCAFVILVCLTGYTSAQWLAGEKFLAGAFAVPEWVALALFAALIIGYTSIGGFRGSVYTDTLQAVIRIAGTVLALVAVGWFAWSDSAAFQKNIGEAGAGFLNLWPGSFAVTLGFILGFAGAGLGFGLGQPQILSRYLAGSSPEETRAAMWVYIGFVQSTWIAMTVFGVLLRGVMPGIADPETGLSVFFQTNIGALATGIIAADVFATIAATSNGLLIAMAQAFNCDILSKLVGRFHARIPLWISTLLIGAVTMYVSTVLEGSVFSLALSSVSLMGAGLAPAVIVKVLRWRHSAGSLLFTIAAGILAAVVWKQSGLGDLLNEAPVGIAVGLLANGLAVLLLNGAKSATPSPATREL